MARSLKPEDYPVDTTRIFKPTKIFFFQSAGGFSTSTRILDLTTAVPADELSTAQPYMTSALRSHAEAAAVNSSTPTAYMVSRKHMLSRTLRLSSSASGGAAVEEASISSALMRLGTWTLAFAGGSTHSSHNIEMKPLGMGKISEVFVKDSVPYFWDMMGGDSGLLHKLEAGKRILVAVFNAMGKGMKKNGLVAVDETLLDVVVVLASCVALLNRMYSFEK